MKKTDSIRSNPTPHGHTICALLLWLLTLPVLAPSQGTAADLKPATGANATVTPSNTGTIATTVTDSSGVWSVNNNYASCNAGSVGLGTSIPTPGVRLEVNGPLRVTAGGSGGIFQIAAPNGETGLGVVGANRFDLRFDGSSVKLVAGTGIKPPFPEDGIVVKTTGNVGIGSLNPVAKLEVVGRDALRLIGDQPFLTIEDDTAGNAASRIQGAGGEMLLMPQSYLNGSDRNAYAKLANSGDLSVKSLNVRGGTVLAESFEFSATAISEGSVVVIDPDSPGKLKPSSEAYDKRVAGIVSGARGLSPGISLREEAILEGGQNVALSGRVYVLADASSDAIIPGDLLTTSNTPGHAMKASDHTRAQGAILGKAMSGLREAKGLVLVLVTLQ
jgi:hypothetical protein